MASPAAVLQVFVNANTKVASAQLAAFDRQLSGVGKTSAATGGSMGKFTKGAAAAGAGIAAVGAVAVVAGKQLYDLGAQFDEAYDTIRVRTGATGRELEKLKGSFKDVAKNVPNDFEDVGKAIGDLNTRLGLTGKPLERMAENMLHLSNITGDDLEGNIKAVSRAFVDWEVTIPQQTRYLDGMFRISQASGASISELADQVQRFGSPLRQLGFSFEEAVSMFASFERAGVNTQTMVPGLKLAISNLTRPTETLAAQMSALGIAAGKPDVALRQIFDLLGDGSKLSQIEKTGLAMDVFGKRAGADMAEAIKQGRFEVDRFLKIFRDQDGDTIRKAADESYDFSENVKILGNNLKVFLEPAANAVFVALDDITRALRQGIREMDGTSKRSTDVGKALKIVREIVYGAGKAFEVFFRTSKRMVEGTAQVVRNLWEVSRNVFRLITALITGNWRKAWDAAKNIVRAAIRVIGGVIKTVTAPVRSVFQTVVEIVRDKFKSAYNAAVNFINGIIKVINKIPGVDIGLISGTGGGRNFGEGSSQRGRAGMQRGGFLMGGKPSGDSIPAMLERGEYVLNREAVKKVGIQRLNQLNFENAPRFQRGGRVGFIDGGAVSRLVDHLPGVNAVKGAATLFGKGAQFFIDKLPKPDLPEPIKGLGPWVIDQVTDFIKERIPRFLTGATALGQAKGQIRQAMGLAISKGLQITSGFPLGTPGAHSPNSYHYQWGRAFDASNGVDTPQMRSYAIEAAARWGQNILELFYDPLGWYIKNGSRVSGAIGDHSDHVHTAMQRGGLVRLQKGGFVGNINRIWNERNSGYGDWGGPTLPSYVVAALAQAAGMPGVTMEQVTRGESGAHAKGTARPGATGIDPGGTKGHGLWMITSGYNEDLAAKVGGWRQMLNPVINAWAASQIYRRQGLGAWYGTGSVTGDGIRYTGNYDISKALGGLSYRGALHFATDGALGEKPKSIAAIRKGAARAIERISNLRGRYKGAKGFLNAALGNAKDARQLASKGEVTKARARLEKARMQIRKAVNTGNPRPGGGRPNKPNKPGIPPEAMIFPEWPFLEANRRVIAVNQERIDLFERNAGAPWSPGGGEYDQNEINGLVELYQTLLASLELQRDKVGQEMERIRTFLVDRQERLNRIMENIASWRARVEELKDKILDATEGEEVKKWRKRIKELEKKLEGPGTASEKKAWRTELKDIRGKLAKKAKPVKGWREKIKQLTGWIKHANDVDVPAYQEFIEEMQGRIAPDGNLYSELESLQGVTGQGGQISDVRWELLNLGHLVPWVPEQPGGGDSGDGGDTGGDTGDGGASPADSAIADLLRQQLFESQRALAIAEAQMPIFQQYLPRFHSGGIVPGYQAGGEVPIMAQAGEGVFTREQMRALSPNPNITVVIEDGAIDKSKIRVEVDGVLADKISSARRQIPGRSYASR